MFLVFVKLNAYVTCHLKLILCFKKLLPLTHQHILKLLEDPPACLCPPLIVPLRKLSHGRSPEASQIFFKLRGGGTALFCIDI